MHHNHTAVIALSCTPCVCRRASHHGCCQTISTRVTFELERHVCVCHLHTPARDCFHQEATHTRTCSTCPAVGAFACARNCCPETRLYSSVHFLSVCALSCIGFRLCSQLQVSALEVADTRMPVCCQHLFQKLKCHSMQQGTSQDDHDSFLIFYA